jgi:hypothetical protein
MKPFQRRFRSNEAPTVKGIGEDGQNVRLEIATPEPGGALLLMAQRRLLEDGVINRSGPKIVEIDRVVVVVAAGVQVGAPLLQAQRDAVLRKTSNKNCFFGVFYLKNTKKTAKSSAA